MRIPEDAYRKYTFKRKRERKLKEKEKDSSVSDEYKISEWGKM